MTAAARDHRNSDRALIIAVAAIVFLLSILPMGRLLWEVIAPQNGSAAASLSRTLSAGSTWTATLNSLQIGIMGTALAMVLGTAVALTVGLTDVRGRHIFVFLYVLPLLIAPQVTALAWLQLFGPASPLLKMLGLAPPLGSRNPLYSQSGIVLLLGVQYGPLVFLMIRAALRKLPRELIEAAQSAGVSRWTVLRTIILPLITPALIGAAALSFVSCVGNFGIPAFLGIPANYLVLPTLIYQKLAGAGPAVLTEVTILSILISVIALAGIVLQDMFSRRRDYRITATSLPPDPFGLGRWRPLVEAALAVLIVLVLVLPLTGLTLSSMVTAYGRKITLSELTLANYAFVLTEHAAAPRAFRNSFGLSFVAAALAVLIAVPMGYMMAWQRNRWTKILNFSVELPYALPGVVLAIAALLLFLKPIPLLGIQIYNTIWIILFAYCARFLVLALRPTIVGYHQLDRGLEEAAQVAGAGLLMRLRTIIFPLVAPATLAGGCLIFLTALSELTVSALLWSSGSETIGVIIFSFEQGGDSSYAAAVSVLTVLTTIALMLGTNLLARHLPNGVLPWRD
ncbi:ABC transporter permease [Paracoccus pacificus]|uniref:ABC transporter permease n=1 Tax=Paracoccus pacificus TaxID=1463598 RepID=A0ABW4R5V2_9RHOB